MNRLDASLETLERKSSVEDSRRARVIPREDMAKVVATTQHKIDNAFSKKVRYTVRLKSG